ncbi:MAG: CDP-diacylglycerol--serine O-phosphatidyltransferase [Theionarchaea archaeon]|nr:CDP-diacylglycerol--serine O-phosphatidyltransferase [Theionarchaea archaeon]MBU7001249.1 CDP-diacylglycerol--serine O-phosphatidyltransferase [Theionarchaea archaeon]MBU7019858.1 CDP-diacylglycerol--serine O-phosphatidyltransferase [Theionarchaea archaeon]MBU7035258.1 CDP-diacylglycerol--serine O-phosphatidyltransferase [Theionarchaea archaeon]
MHEMQIYLKKADILTILNISLGFIAIVFLINNNIDMAARLILAAIVADGFDGYFARKSNTESEFGMNFDSLSDCVSFGVAPALLIYSFVDYWWIIAVSVVYLTAGIMRLARYNVSFKETEEGTFVGMPIPIGALLLVFAVTGHLPEILVIGAALLVSYLMVCSITFKKIASGRFPVQNLAVLLLAAFPVSYFVPAARIAFAGCMGGLFIKKRRENSHLSSSK